MGRVEGKVAFITGAARGQGRSHAVHLAREGADIIAIDICAPIQANAAPPATEEELAETARLVEATGRRIVARRADVREYDELKAAVDEGLEQFGHLDIVCANAGVSSYGKSHELAEASWKETIDINLTGVWQTCRVAIPTLIEQGTGGAIIITSSTLGMKALPNLSHYVSSKHGLIGLMRALALELGPHQIRVNAINPGTVDTALVRNPATAQLFGPDLDNPTVDDVIDRFRPLHPMGIPWVDVDDISEGVVYLASDSGRYVTGIALSVDGGASIR